MEKTEPLQHKQLSRIAFSKVALQKTNKRNVSLPSEEWVANAYTQPMVRACNE